MTQGSANWYCPESVSYIESSATAYNGQLYRKDYNADDGYYYTAVSGPFYRNYSKSRLMFADESNNIHTLYDSTLISASAHVSSGTGTTITVLAQK